MKCGLLKRAPQNLSLTLNHVHSPTINPETELELWILRQFGLCAYIYVEGCLENCRNVCFYHFNAWCCCHWGYWKGNDRPVSKTNSRFNSLITSQMAQRLNFCRGDVYMTNNLWALRKKQNFLMTPETTERNTQTLYWVLLHIPVQRL